MKSVVFLPGSLNECPPQGDFILHRVDYSDNAGVTWHIDDYFEEFGKAQQRIERLQRNRSAKCNGHMAKRTWRIVFIHHIEHISSRYP